MKRSTIRELLKLTSQPGMISFAGGLPAPETFPVDALRAASDKVLATLGSRSLQYSESEGITPLRDWVASRFATNGAPVRRENVVILNGSQQALDLVGRVLLDENDSVLVENPTYLALLSAWRPLGAQFRAIPDSGGVLDLEALLSLFAANPKLAYLIPNYQNPQGSLMPLAHRHQIAQFLREHGQLLVEDNPYGDLRYEGEALPDILHLNARQDSSGGLETEVIRTGTFSKVLAPGLRLGYVVASQEIIEKIVLAKQSADLHTSSFSQYLVLELLQTGLLDTQLPKIRALYRERRDAMLAAMERYFPDAIRWTRPQGGMFLLATLPNGVNTSDLLPAALEQKVAFVPGADFHLDGRGENTMRLNFSFNPPEVIADGIRRLGQVLHQALGQCPRQPAQPAGAAILAGSGGKLTVSSEASVLRL